MSLQTWLDEFYPVRAEVLEPKATVVELLLHALQKWRGLTTENLGRHGVVCSERRVHADETTAYLDIDDLSCPLCARFHSESRRCGDCPLVLLRGKSCDRTLKEEVRSPWASFRYERDPTPMIRLLEQALERERGVKCPKVCPECGNLVPVSSTPSPVGTR